MHLMLKKVPNGNYKFGKIIYKKIQNADKALVDEKAIVKTKVRNGKMRNSSFLLRFFIFKERMIAAYHQLIAHAKVVTLAHEINKENQVGSMYGGIFSYPATCHPDDIMVNETFMKNYMFYVDVQNRGYYPSYKRKERELFYQYKRKMMTF